MVGLGQRESRAEDMQGWSRHRTVTMSVVFPESIAGSLDKII
jgi:hypothetical protein